MSVTHTLTIRGLDTQSIQESMIAVLREDGYIVTRPRDGMRWETPSEFCRRVGMHPGSFRRRWRAPGLPAIETERGPKNSIRRLIATPAFEAFMLANKS